MAARIDDDFMTAEHDRRVIATAQYSAHAAADGQGAWIVSGIPHHRRRLLDNLLPEVTDLTRQDHQIPADRRDRLLNQGDPPVLGLSSENLTSFTTRTAADAAVYRTMSAPGWLLTTRTATTGSRADESAVVAAASVVAGAASSGARDDDADAASPAPKDSTTDSAGGVVSQASGRAPGLPPWTTLRP